jgi:hypothetical protein
MHIVREECDERLIRVDRMIDEFRKAQSRRLAKATAVKGDDQVVESRDAPAPGRGSWVNDYTDFTLE